MDTRPYRIGIDVGGTFTDLVLRDGFGANVCYYKEPSTPDEPSLAVERGIAGLLDRAGIHARDIEYVVHGTTLGLNTIIQRRGARIALVVSRGNRDVLEIGRIHMPEPLDMFGVRPDPLIPRDLVFEVSARTAGDGTTVSRPGAEEVDELAGRLRRSEVAAVAVALINAYRYPELEAEVANALRARLPDLLVCESRRVWPEIREYERAMVASLNTYIGPQLNAYFNRLSERLKDIGIGGSVFITTNNGGTVGIQTARERPIDTVLSGPASGVVASCKIAAAHGIGHFITFDMGGTSSDMALVVGTHPEYATHSVVGDFPLILPVVNVSGIGAGGGSVIWIDGQGILKVGPESSGAHPGPVCYGRGGTQPTVTDCFLVLGLLRVDGFLDGRMTLDREAAVEALAAIGSQLGYDGPDVACRVAEAALRIATTKMATEVQRSFAQRGHDPRDFALVAYGGAGPTHAGLLANELKLPRLVIPSSPGTLCALGAVESDLKRDFVRTIRSLLRDGFEDMLAGSVSELVADVAEWMSGEGGSVAAPTHLWTAEMRYRSEGIGMNIMVPEDTVTTSDIAGLSELFHRTHEAQYGFRLDSEPVELLALRLQAVCAAPATPIEAVSRPEPMQAPAAGMRRVFFEGKWLEAAVHRRSDLRPAHSFAGPALVEQEDTTVWVLPGWRAQVHGSGVISCERVTR